VHVCGTDEENECRVSLKQNMPLAMAFSLLLLLFLSIHTHTYKYIEQTNYVEQKIDGL
jgi:hypothetical protein